MAPLITSPLPLLSNSGTTHHITTATTLQLWRHSSYHHCHHSPTVAPLIISPLPLLSNCGATHHITTATTLQQWCHSSYHHCHNLIINLKWTVTDWYKRLVGYVMPLFTTCYVTARHGTLIRHFFNTNIIHNYMQLKFRYFLTKISWPNEIKGCGGCIPFKLSGINGLLNRLDGTEVFVALFDIVYIAFTCIPIKMLTYII